MAYKLYEIQDFKTQVNELIHNENLQKEWKFGICHMTRYYRLCSLLFQELYKVQGTEKLKHYNKLSKERVFILLLLDIIPEEELLQMVNYINPEI